MNDATITLIVNGKPVEVPSGTTVAAALFMADTAARVAISGEPRSAVCGMGVCMECRATINGVHHVRTCLMTAESGMQVTTE